MELSFSGPFVPWNFRSRDRSREWMVLQCLFVSWTKVPGNECSRERIVLRTKVPGNECSRERMVPRTKVPSWERMFQEWIFLGTNIPVSGKMWECASWSRVWQIFNVEKCKFMNLGYNNWHGGSSDLVVVELVSFDEEKDWGVMISNGLKWEKHCSEVMSKANQILGLIKRNISDKSYFCSLIWSVSRTDGFGEFGEK